MAVALATYEAIVDEAGYEELAHLGTQLAGLENSIRAARLVQIRALSSHAEFLQADGHRGVVDWLTQAIGLSRSSAVDMVRVASVSLSCPRLTERFASGAMSWDRFSLITTGLIGNYDDDWWIEHESGMSDAQIRALIRARRRAAVDLGSAFAERKVTARRLVDRGILSAVLPLDMFETVVSAIDRIAEVAPIQADTGSYPSVHKARADALVEICSTKLSDDSDADRATVVIHAPVGALTGDSGSGSGSGSGSAELDETLLTSETFQRICCDSRIQLIGTDFDGRSVGVGRTTRSIPPWMYRLLKKRDRGCCFPGCGKRRWVNAHHIQFWSEGGRTDLDNLVLLCVSHHHYVHELGWSISGNPEIGFVTFIRPDGKELRVGGHVVAQSVVRTFQQRLGNVVPADDALLAEAVGLPRRRAG